MLGRPWGVRYREVRAGDRRIVPHRMPPVRLRRWSEFLSLPTNANILKSVATGIKKSHLNKYIFYDNIWVELPENSWDGPLEVTTIKAER